MEDQLKKDEQGTAVDTAVPTSKKNAKPSKTHSNKKKYVRIESAKGSVLCTPIGNFVWGGDDDVKSPGGKVYTLPTQDELKELLNRPGFDRHIKTV